MAHVPASTDEIDPAWLSAVLKRPISSFQSVVLEGGVLTDVHRIESIEYGDQASAGDGAPTSLILKLPTRDPNQRALAQSSGIYEKEVEFFRDLTGRVPLRTPSVHHAVWDPSEGDFSFVLLLEDLTSHSRVFDQVEDTPDAEASTRIALDVAEMHAAFWRSPELTRAPISRGPRYVFPMDDACRDAPDRLEDLERTWRDLIGRHMFEDDGAAASEEMTRLLCGPECGVILDRIQDRFSTRPHTLLHGDLRADNIFRSWSGSSTAGDAQRFTYVDWQMYHAGPPGPEFAQAWISSLPPSERREDRAMLRAYHERLVTLNPSAAEYSYEMLVEDYIHAGILWWAALVTIGANALSSEGVAPSARMIRLWSQCLPWVFSMLEDHDALGHIHALLDGATNRRTR